MPLACLIRPLAILLLVLSLGCVVETTPVVPTVTQISRTLAVEKSTATPEPSPQPGDDPLEIILGRPTDHSIAVDILSSQDRQVMLVYGIQGGGSYAQSEMIDLKANLPQTVELDGLSPDTAYIYQVVSGDLILEEHTFQTQRAAGESFTFTIDADPHNRDPRFDGRVFSAVMENILQDAPDFHINLGDTFMTEKVKAVTSLEVQQTFLEMRRYFAISGGDVPLFLVNGNHEGEVGWLLQGKDGDVPLSSAGFRQLYYPGPVPGDFFSGSEEVDPWLGGARDGYYAWNWGDALFIVLDPFWYTTNKPRAEQAESNWSWTLGEEQYAWLRSTLEQSQAQYKFIFIHHLVGGSGDARGGIEVASLYEWGGRDPDGSDGFDQERPGWGMPIHPLLVENQVSAVFHGHDHVYVQQELDGVIYQELPQSSNPDLKNEHLAGEYGYLSGIVRGGSGYLRVRVTPEQAVVEFILADGSVEAAYQILPAR